MTAKELIERVERTEPVQLLAKSAADTIRLRSVSGSLLSMLIATDSHRRGGVQVVVMEDRDAASYLYSDIYNILGQWGAAEEKVLLLPTAYKRSIQTQREDPSGIVQRTAVLSALQVNREMGTGSDNSLIICTYPEALAEKVADRKLLAENTMVVKIGDKLSISFIEEVLQSMHFTRVDFVYEPGQYSIRGGIVDIFSYSASKPFRIDLFGDEVDTIRTFNISNQLSADKQERVDIVPNLKNTELVQQRISLFQYIGTNATIWFDSTSQTIGKIEQLNAKIEDDTITVQSFIADTASWRWLHLDTGSTIRPADQEIEFRSAPQPTFNKNFELLARDIREGATQGYTTYILTENKAQIERLENILGQIAGAKTGFGSVSLTLSRGFIFADAHLSLYTDHQIFDRHLRYKVHNEIDRSESITIQELNALKVGDYVVHIDHGVGKFGGLVRSHEGGVTREFVKLTYKDNDTLFVNVHSLHRISKYKDKESPEPPRINKLGSGAWQKLKATTKSKVKDIARELIALYAKRKASIGFAYSPDTYLQQELESSFIYEDTPDQRTATDAIKADMELAEPMDRLVCGDVGFGKTEVAMRAAFKAVTDGKQVAVLVPTTVLSLQHYRTFSRRLKEFPVNIENFSRVKSTKQTHEILDRLKAGKVDILIGTHKLLGKMVEFKDLGLLIIDEEQKFGVTSKEKLRALKANVDTLTLTATPIPRTLQFSLMGARDMSIINTPPPNRQPVATEVHNYNEEIICEAIEYEMQRGGQVFFLNNRVENIHRVKSMIERICPKAKVAVGHGQMPPTELETVMMDFIYGEYDVFVATTIIESGIDIPNANTIIINNAQNFGLSDLHQLRGRVGRTNRKAFCYLLIPSAEAVTSDAHRRLRAIEEFSDLGSGFNIAMQDLDIRGAGNVLGAEQSGFIADIGFETYQKIMAEAVAELREEQGLEPEAATIECHIESETTAHLPDSYISNTAEKIRLYRELDNITRQEDMSAFIGRLKDRFGEPPAEAFELFDIVLLRHTAALHGFEKVTLKNGISRLTFAAANNNNYYRSERFAKLMKRVSENSSKYKLDQSSNNKLVLIVRGVCNFDELRRVISEIV